MRQTAVGVGSALTAMGLPVRIGHTDTVASTTRTQHIMLEFKAPRVEIPSAASHVQFQRYPEESIEDWH